MNIKRETPVVDIIDSHEKRLRKIEALGWLTLYLVGLATSACASGRLREKCNELTEKIG